LQAVILVGGEGTRLRPLTYGTPKPMIPLFGVPFLERMLVRLRQAGVDEVILAAGYLPEMLESHFGSGDRVGVKLSYVVEESPLGTAGAIKNLERYIHGPFFVLNGDVLTDLDLRKMADFHRSKGGLGVLHAIRVDDPSAFGCIVRDPDGRILTFVEKPRRADAPTDEVNAGTYLLERRILDAIPAGRAVSIEREIFPEVIAAGELLYSFVTADYWLDIGRPQQYLQAHGDILDGKLVLAGPGERWPARGSMWRFGAFEPPTNVRPPVFVGDDVSIDPTAVVGPYAVLGDGCRIGAGARVRDAILWDGVEVDAGARISDAIIASNVRVGARAVVEAGAVVGHGASIAPGTVLEADARVTAT
jgi:mannose-1-phosphate guanylyltransferase